jgi:hypothetical protein
MRTQAIREASDELFKTGVTVDRESEAWTSAISDIKAKSPAKLVFVNRVTIGGRKLFVDTGKGGLYNKYTTKITFDDNEREAYTGNADYEGLHKVPIYTKVTRDKAEDIIMDLAEIVNKHLGNMTEYDPDDLLEALRAISEDLPDSGKTTSGGVYTDEEKAQIETWKNKIVSRYMNPEKDEEV